MKIAMLVLLPLIPLGVFLCIKLESREWNNGLCWICKQRWMFLRRTVIGHNIYECSNGHTTKISWEKKGRINEPHKTARDCE